MKTPYNYSVLRYIHACKHEFIREDEAEHFAQELKKEIEEHKV